MSAPVTLRRAGGRGFEPYTAALESVRTGGVEADPAGLSSGELWVCGRLGCGDGMQPVRGLR